MVTLTNQKDFRQAQKLPFCYLCGSYFAKNDIKNKDHVPPKSIFNESDREPLILPTHVECNNKFSENDEKVGQLISSQSGKIPEPKNRKLIVTIHPDFNKVINIFV